MVGVVIGLIAILVIYQVFAVSEGLRRNTTGVGDAQQNGLLSSFALGIELANAGNGISASAQEALRLLEPVQRSRPSPYRPVPVLITDSGGANKPDEFSVFYSASTSLVTPVPFGTVPTHRMRQAPISSSRARCPARSTRSSQGDMVDRHQGSASAGCLRALDRHHGDRPGRRVRDARALAARMAPAVAFTSESLLFNLGQAETASSASATTSTRRPTSSTARTCSSGPPAGAARLRRRQPQGAVRHRHRQRRLPRRLGVGQRGRLGRRTR